MRGSEIVLGDRWKREGTRNVKEAVKDDMECVFEGTE